jgi:3-keto-disaccharide hydrolase
VKRLSHISIGLIVLVVSAFGCAQMGARSDAGWITLFDGRNLDNFNTVGDANWRLEDGLVVADKKGKENGYLVTKNAYKDYELRVEFWVSNDANSGIYMRCKNPRVITDKTCYEANIFDTRPDPSYGTGAITNFAKISSPPKTGGKWNTYDITARGSRIVVVLNGMQTVELQHSEFASGPIALQYGQGVVKFRKVQIRPL